MHSYRENIFFSSWLKFRAVAWCDVLIFTLQSPFWSEGKMNSWFSLVKDKGRYLELCFQASLINWDAIEIRGAVGSSFRWSASHRTEAPLRSWYSSSEFLEQDRLPCLYSLPYRRWFLCLLSSADLSKWKRKSSAPYYHIHHLQDSHLKSIKRVM